MKPYLPNYSFEKALGSDSDSDSLATCYLAVHAHTHERVYIKVIPKQQCRNEILILKQVSHPSIIRFIDCMEDDAYIYLVEEFIDGNDVFELVAEENLTEKEAKKIFKQLLEAVEYLHSKNISHGDIKIENVVSDQEKNIRLIDFEFSNQSEARLNFFGGTLEYAPPEILKGIPFYGMKADLWSLGVFLFVLLSGEHPFNGDRKEILKQIEREEIDFSEIPKGAKEIIRKLLIINPDDRQNVKEILKSSWFEEERIDVFEEIMLEEDILGLFEII
jgi:serine/threonine protein kinase